MKYCIYKGAIYKVDSEASGMVYLSGVYGRVATKQEKAMEVPEEIYLQVQEEYETAVKKVREVAQQIYQLNDEYYKSHTTLQELRLVSGRREKEIVNRVMGQTKAKIDSGKDFVI